MPNSYDHQKLEEKWRKKWTEEKLYETPDHASGKDNFYTLVEFPYPSGDLHVGHWYAFSVPDIFARMKRMRGANVLYPIGFDAFGLPAENAAIKNKVDPAKWTLANIERMRTQLKSMGAMFDWSREAAACDPMYYKWTQWLFLQLYEKGLAYKGKAFVNWDPVDMTVLANEQVLPDGTAERSGAKVEKKELEQWFLKITDYAERLLSELDALQRPEPIKVAQRNWIGKSEGAEIDFPLIGSEEKITVFTTRADTLYGGTFLVLAPEHPLVSRLSVQNRAEVDAYVAQAKTKGEIERTGSKEKTGVELEGIKAVNPATKEEIPIFIADYVLAGYGTGAVMGVPAHDERDFGFANNFDCKIVPVIEPPLSINTYFHFPPSFAFLIPEGANVTELQLEKVKEKIKLLDEGKICYTGDGKLKNSGEFNGFENEVSKEKIAAKFGNCKTTYKLRDWLVSRQRYWGAPIPIVYDPEGKPHAIPDEHLPWLLPTDVDFTPTGVAPLARSKELLERTEKIFGKGWKPETDTFDTFVDSSWYFLRYLDPKNDTEFSALEKQKAWMPIARYSGGAEHTTMHLLYSRFFYKALFDLGLVTAPEPYAVRLNRGIILAEDGRKMSKRWGNVVNPDEQVANVGADAVRTYLAFIGPYNEVGSYPWSTNGLVGVRRFLERVWGLKEKVGDAALPPETSILLNQTIKKTGDDIEAMKFNTSVSALMILSNELGKLSVVPQEAYETLVKLLAPFAPHLADELWEQLGHKASVHLETWPSFDASKLAGETVTVAVQVAGKTRRTVSVPRGAVQEAVLTAGKKYPKRAPFVPENPKRVVFVPDKVLNVIPTGSAS